MKNSKRILSVLLVLCMVVTLFSSLTLSANAATITSGTTGAVTWTLDGTKLTISGSGKMGDYDKNGNKASWGRKITEVVIESGVTSIGEYAFYDCFYLENITIPDSVTSIGYGAFENTAYYNNASNWENGVLYIGKHLIEFDSKNISNSYSIKNGTLIIAEGAFISCSNLENITIPDSVTSINDGTFENCSSLKSITIPDSVTSIGDIAFRHCSSLGSITIPANVISIGGDAFYNTAYYNNASNWENGVLYIGKHLIEFNSKTNLNSCSIRNGTLTLADKAFLYCSSLESIRIPTSVTSIGDKAFWGCSSLKSITIPTSVTSIGDDAFRSCSDELVICGKSGSYAEKYAKDNSITFTACQHTDTYIDGAKAATCTKKGYTGDTKCNACGAVTAKGKTIPKSEHKTKTTVAKATQTANGVSVTTCTICGKVTKTVTISNIKSIELDAAKYVYNGKTKTPNVVVKDSSGETLKEGTDYTVTYASGRKNVGKYTVKVTLKGNYSGSKTLSFKINPEATALKSLSAGKKQITVKWNKKTTQTTGYQIQYSTSSNFKNAKTVTVSKNKTTLKTIKNLKGGKKYYVRVRTYKTVKNTKYYSSWSAKKLVMAKNR